ncbi:protein MAL2 isoform X2 [Lates calcarifer]|uniref:Protein MAL2 isoform X2 n=1 Tax=Lates calcarifer TaxID=8187 RepID=A0AAJ8BFP9_LATCA|nr:protein MAL2 isoform X2 [Lates calcarifer]
MSEPAANPAATSFPAPTISLPLGLEVLRTYSGALVCLEICLCQLRLEDYSIYNKVHTTSVFSDVFYHFIALLFYFAAFVLEAATTAANGGAHVKPLPNSTDTVLCITYPRGNIFTVLSDKQYSINVAATIFAFVVTLCYGCSMLMGFKRWRM